MHQNSILFLRDSLGIHGLGKVGLGYHWDGTGISPLLGHLQVKQRADFLGVLKVELVEAANAREEDTVIELLHVPTCLLHDGRVCWAILLLRGYRLWSGKDPLGEVIQPNGCLSLLAPDLLVTVARYARRAADPGS